MFRLSYGKLEKYSGLKLHHGHAVVAFAVCPGTERLDTTVALEVSPHGCPQCSRALAVDYGNGTVTFIDAAVYIPVDHEPCIISRLPADIYLMLQ